MASCRSALHFPSDAPLSTLSLFSGMGDCADQHVCMMHVCYTLCLLFLPVTGKPCESSPASKFAHTSSLECCSCCQRHAIEQTRAIARLQLFSTRRESERQCHKTLLSGCHERTNVVPNLLQGRNNGHLAAGAEALSTRVHLCLSLPVTAGHHWQLCSAYSGRQASMGYH